MFKNGCDIGSHTACFYDENRLVNWRSEDKVKEDINYIRCVLQTYCKDNGIDCSKLDKEEFKYEKTDDSYTCDKDNLLDRYMSLINDTNYLRDKVTQLFTQNNSKKLKMQLIFVTIMQLKTKSSLKILHLLLFLTVP